MRAVDTNVLVRLMTRDDVTQVAATERRLVQRAGLPPRLHLARSSFMT